MNLDNLVVNDCEVYPNYTLIAFKNIENNKVVTIECVGQENSFSNDQKRKIQAIFSKRTVFGFNNTNYDMPIIMYALSGATCAQIHRMSDTIIDNQLYAWQTYQKFNLKVPHQWDIFDVQEPAPGVKVSLKLYGGRLHSKRLQDLPIEPGTILTEEERIEIKLYCINDLDTTIDLFRKIKDRIELRKNMSEQYGQNLMSKSDAQIAEVVIKSELEKLNPKWARTKGFKKPTIPGGTTFKYHPPEFINFESDELNEVFDLIKNHNFKLDAKGSIELPKALKNMKIQLGNSVYQLGIGGIHSTESKQAIIPNKYQILADRDVAAYYPNIILNLGLYPRHLGEMFLKVYKAIVEERIRAKKAGEVVTNESLKIVINGSFGKLGSKYSILYSPDLMMTVTITGQLSLLMLIEKLELNGINVVSANTDGFVSLMNKSKYDLYDDICFNWELDTGFELEETLYKALYSANVNNYLAIKPDNSTKGKGALTLDNLQKNPASQIAVKAAIEFLSKGTPVPDTIKGCTDVREFISVRTVKGGATWKNEYLGKVVRWIYSTEGDNIYYKKLNDKKGAVLESDGKYYRRYDKDSKGKNVVIPYDSEDGNKKKVSYVPHNKVPKTEGARPLMELGDFPKDIDYDCYINEAINIIDNLGACEF